MPTPSAVLAFTANTPERTPLLGPTSSHPSSQQRYDQDRSMTQEDESRSGKDRTIGCLRNGDREERGNEGDEEGEDKSKEGEKIGKKFKEIWVLCLGLWASLFVSAAASTLITNLQFEIATSFSSGHLASWLGGGYLLGLAALTPIWGRLCGVLGRRGCMLLAMSLFVLGTIGCAFSPTMGVMIGSRIVAGSGGGGLFTVSSIIIADLVSLADRGLYQGLVNVVITLGTAMGSIIGGSVADLAGWRAAFYCQFPLLAIASVLILWKVHLPPSPTGAGTEPSKDETWQHKLQRIDWLGCLFVVLATSSLMISLSLHTSLDVPLSSPRVWGLLLLTFLSTIAFYYVEEYHAKEPVVPMELVRMRTPVVIFLAMGFYTSTLYARMYILPIYLKLVRSFSSQFTGTLLIPGGVSGSIASLFAGAYMQRTGKYKGLTILACFLPLLSSWSVMRWGRETNVHRVWIEMAIANLGGGIMITTMLTGLIASVPTPLIPIAISASFLFRSIGQVLGVSLSFAAQQFVLERTLLNKLGDGAGEIITEIIHRPSSTIPMLPDSVRDKAIDAYLLSIQSVFIFVAGSGVVILVCVCLMRSYPLPGR